MPVDPSDAVEPALDIAVREGLFDNLPGKGKPLKLDPSPDAVVNNLLKDAGFKPEWVEVGQQAEALQQQAAETLERFSAELQAIRADVAAGREVVAAPAERPSWLRRLWRGDRSDRSAEPVARVGQLDARWEPTLRRYAHQLHEANRKLRRYNELVPLPGRQKPLIPVAERLEQFRQQCPRLAITDGALVERLGKIPAELLTGAGRDKGEKLLRTQEQLQSSREFQRLGRKPPAIG